MAGNSNKDSQLNWIYEGTKALVNREDYLLGKKLDKNFEMYSDVVTKDKEDNFEALTSGRPRGLEPSNIKVSNLEINVVRKEDPLVAIKVKEEKLRQEKLENPLVLMRMERILREAMEKKARKLRKKEEKAKRKRKKKPTFSHGNGADYSLDKKKHRHSNKNKHQNSPLKKHHRHKKNNEHTQRKQNRENFDRLQTISVVDNKGNERSVYGKRLQNDDELKECLMAKLNREEASTSDLKGDAEGINQKKVMKQFDSHIPEHLRPKYDTSSDSYSDAESCRSSQESSGKNASLKNYGLIDEKKAEKRALVTSNYSGKLSVKSSPRKYVKPHRRKLTEEEVEAKRKEMMENAEWRDATRKRTLEKVVEKEKLEEKDNEGKPVDFIKPMLNDAACTMTVEKRLNSTRHGLQKSYGYMEEKFTKR